MTKPTHALFAITFAACATTSTPQVDGPSAPAEPAPTVALMVRLEAKPEFATAVASLLRDGKMLVDAEAATPYWFALQLGPTTFGIFDAFGDDAGRQLHLKGELATALLAKAPEVLAQAPTIEPVTVMGNKHAFAGACREVAKGLVVRIAAKPETATQVEALIQSGPSVVAGEPGTPVWFGVRVDATTFAIFDAFKTVEDRQLHLEGKLAKALIANANLLASAPTIEPADVIASKQP
jgi:quinol monooxygenase YgiN